MEVTGAAFWLFLLLSQLPLSRSEGFSTVRSKTGSKAGNAVPATEQSPNTTDHIGSSLNDAYGNCLIDTQMGLIAVGTAGGLIVCLLVVIVVLAWQVYHIQQRVSAPRTSRSNMDLVSSTGYWGIEQAEVGGLVGPCDASVMLEEVREESTMDEGRQAELRELITPVGMGLEEDMDIQMHSSMPSDSCLVVPKDLEDMPLVV